MASGPTIEAAKRTLVGKDVTVHVGDLAKIAKKVAGKNGYGFVEVAQRSRSGNTEFEFLLAHKFDFFARDEIKVELSFENLKSGKDGAEQGDVLVKIVGKVFLDYRNDWGKSQMLSFLFKIYMNYFAKPKIGRLYIGPCVKLVESLYEEYKNALDLPS